VTEANFDKYFGINVKGTLFTVQKALPLMREGASIVINGSMVSVKGLPAFGVYAATKAALRSFARTWAVDLAGRGIRVNVVSPGTVVTPAYKALMTDEQIEGFTLQAAATTPLGRVGTADEIGVDPRGVDDADGDTGDHVRSPAGPHARVIGSTREQPAQPRPHRAAVARAALIHCRHSRAHVGQRVVSCRSASSSLLAERLLMRKVRAAASSSTIAGSAIE
jgi:hypothetical protein